MSVFNSLLAGGDGLLYGTLTGGDGPELFVFDPKKRTFVSRSALPAGSPLDIGLQFGPDGFIYGFTTSGIYRFHPGTAPKPEMVVRQENGFSVPGPIIGKEAYFAKDHTLRAVRLFR